MPPGAKISLLVVLVLSFAVQAYLVYTDEPSAVKLTGPALDGAQRWHRYNCQSCHQLYGFGGFLGPDLTNVAARYDAAGLSRRLSFVLEQGSGQMPSFDVGRTDLLAFAAFFRTMDRTGNGELRRPARAAGDGAPSTRFEAAINAEMEDEPAAAARAGFRLFRARGCQACHAPLAVSALGAPDLSTVGERLSREAQIEVLTNGLPPKMPPPSPALSAGEREQVTRFMAWMGSRRDALAARLGDGSGPRIVWSEIPWWEYP